ncbi:glycoside hydrolase family 3 C-terminal domain-containing protein [Aestuariibaculum lutulentum]|uniref:Glycoside hydrolase family 3 C-terminal domain-containing protein n=1 Tax=Aestuariibaculum lutulentum TaxID=2920935 RepID=A0ABS9RJM3_9FLAO|nr:glycoside hydrolase family 3 C-terminal domain-containing protein [Aestuariibaculum lutulentum]MCH4552686.1 glycoside hydrolase family 3 C-terminal domain-containing protein [Aestuariibaculum lutulentum]
MKKHVIYMTVLSAFLFASSCKQNEKETEPIKPKETVEVTYQGVPITNAYDAKIDSLIALMTIEEKTGMLHGNSMFATKAIERLGIPELTMADGPLGVREEISRDSWAAAGWDNDFATYYPAGGGLAATWNTELSYVFGTSVGEEAIARDKDVLLSPAINIIRTPLGGRTYEYFTEDPFLNKKLTVPFIVGVQENDVAVCVKHYAANNQETHRDYVDVQIDERALREIYLPAFKAAVQEAQAYSFMGAYNKFRGEYLCENGYMLNDVLRDEWGFKGIVISDWAAVHDTKKSIENGLDVEMGTPKPFNEFFYADALIEKVKSGIIAEADVDVHVKRILQLMFSLKSIDDVGRAKGSINTEDHFQDAYKIAAESVVLLKNENNQLPIKLDGVKSIAVIGNNAKKKNALGGFGAGVKTKREVTPLEGLQNRLPESVTINYAEGYLERYSNDEKAKLGDITLNGPVTIDKLEPDMLEEAIKAAKSSDVAIIFAGSNRDYETEASDRASLQLPFGQEELIEKVLEVNPNTIVVMIAGAPFDIQNVSQKSSALIWSWFNGSEGGNALADVILGTVNPSGKLPWTMPKNLEDSPAHATHSFPGDESVNYTEGILVGYRWFDTKNVEPLYPFGYGLSYTKFEFSDLKTNKSAYKSDEVIQVSFNVKNTGDFEGKEVAQLYVSDPESYVDKAAKELKGFKKVFVKSGEVQQVSIKLPVKELAYYNEVKKSWLIEPGEYVIKLGNSSRNIEAEVIIEVKD